MATSDRRIETPTGSKFGAIFSAMDILGVSSHLTQTDHQPNGVNGYLETVNISVPVGTVVIVPVPNFWMLGYGRLKPDLLDTADDNQSVQWNSADHNWGIGRVHVSVVDVNAIDNSTSPPSQNATLNIMMRLHDDNGDDGWWGMVGYTLVYLGQASSREPHGERRMSRIMKWEGNPIR
jgi:hypothetical protein